MQSYLKTRPAWIQLLVFFGMAFGIWTVLTFIGVMMLTKITGLTLTQISDVSRWDSSNPDMIFFIRGMLLLQFLGLFVIPSFLFAYLSDPVPLRYLGFKPPVKKRFWIFAVVLLIAAMPLVEYLGLLNRQVVSGMGMQRWVQSMEDEAVKQLQFMLARHTVSELILNLIFISLFAGFGEELFFRAVVQRLFIQAFQSPWAGIFMAALIFSAIHFQFFGFVPRLLLGILLGAVYWYSGSLWPAILSHFTYDAFIIILTYVKPELVKNAEASPFDQSQLSILALGSAVVVGVIFWQMRKNAAHSYEVAYKNGSSSDDYTH